VRSKFKEKINVVDSEKKREFLRNSAPSNDGTIFEWWDTTTDVNAAEIAGKIEPRMKENERNENKNEPQSLSRDRKWPWNPTSIVYAICMHVGRVETAVDWLIVGYVRIYDWKWKCEISLSLGLFRILCFIHLTSDTSYSTLRDGCCVNRKIT